MKVTKLIAGLLLLLSAGVSWGASQSFRFDVPEPGMAVLLVLALLVYSTRLYKEL